MQKVQDHYWIPAKTLRQPVISQPQILSLMNIALGIHVNGTDKLVKPKTYGVPFAWNSILFILKQQRCHACRYSLWWMWQDGTLWSKIQVWVSWVQGNKYQQFPEKRYTIQFNHNFICFKSVIPWKTMTYYGAMIFCHIREYWMCGFENLSFFDVIFPRYWDVSCNPLLC